MFISRASTRIHTQQKAAMSPSSRFFVFRLFSHTRYFRFESKAAWCLRTVLLAY